LLDRLDHPSIACCWNTFDAALAGDMPAVAIPTLNSRIRYVILQDGQRNENALTECNPGEGNLPLRNTTNRLRGIGFDGWLRVGLAQTSKADESQLEQSLRPVLSALQQWQVLPTPVSAR
jgi:sugar phosphate isomerase/epimerase